MIDFLDIRVLDIIDILLVSLLFYFIYKIIRGSAAMYIFFGIAFIYLFWKLVVFFELDLLSEILGKFMSIGVIILVIVFQKEIRNFLTIIGVTNMKSKNIFFNKFSKKNKNHECTGEIIKSLYEMSKKKIGVLIAIEKNTRLDFLVETGDYQNIDITESILESIFYPNSPLHDGAVIISKKKIIGTRVILLYQKIQAFRQNTDLDIELQ